MRNYGGNAASSAERGRRSQTRSSSRDAYKLERRNCFAQRWITITKLTLHDPPLLLLVLAAVSPQVPCANIATRARAYMSSACVCKRLWRDHIYTHVRIHMHFRTRASRQDHSSSPRAAHFTSSVTDVKYAATGQYQLYRHLSNQWLGQISVWKTRTQGYSFYFSVLFFFWLAICESDFTDFRTF